MNRIIVTCVLVLSMVGCGDDPGPDPVPVTDMAFGLTVTSSAFEPGGTIPAKYTCDGENVSPPLEWSGDDSVTAGPYAVVMDDQDAEGFLHWFVYGIGGRALREGDVRGALEGPNDFGDLGYGGPCPPEGDGEHRYTFRVYQLRSVPSPLEPGQSPLDIIGRDEENAVAVGTLTVTYER